MALESIMVCKLLRVSVLETIQTTENDENEMALYTNVMPSCSTVIELLT